MGMNIRCTTLFNITKTGITNRKPPLGMTDEASWNKQRNMQYNLDTIIQVISLRAQPENITDPVQSTLELDKSDKFGFLLKSDEPVQTWSFKFYVNHSGVFLEGNDDLGALYNDCDQVPMLLIGDECQNLTTFLDTTPELKNIYFEILDNE